MKETLTQIYKLNSDINRITSQLKQVNDNPGDYVQQDFDNINESYLTQLAQKTDALNEICNVQIQLNAQ